MIATTCAEEALDLLVKKHHKLGFAEGQKDIFYAIQLLKTKVFFVNNEAESRKLTPDEIVDRIHTNSREINMGDLKRAYENEDGTFSSSF